MSEYLNLRITRAMAPEAVVPDSTYWLRFEQGERGDVATVDQVNQLADELYDIEPCIEVENAGDGQPEQEEPTEEKLYKAARDVFGTDLAACRKAMSGAYDATIKIYRSHLNEAYRLEMTAGKVKQTVVVPQTISANIDVKQASSIELEYAVATQIAAGWLGPVIGSGGIVTAPAIKRKGNVLYWGKSVTGTIRVEYDTEYDQVTIEVPGIPTGFGSEIGTSQEVKLLAFYHLMVFPGEINAPEEDDTVTVSDMRRLCGYNKTGDLGGTEEDEEDKPLPQEPEPPEYGCQEYSVSLSSPAARKAICCSGGSAPACLLRTARHPGGASLDQETIDRYLAANPHTEFRAVAPPGAEGCGTVYYRLHVSQKNCCDEAPPIVVPDVDRVVGDNSRIALSVSGGKDGAEWHWSVRHTGAFLNAAHTMRDITTAGPNATLYTTEVCGTIHVSVSDGCTGGDVVVRAETGQWVSKSYWHKNDAPNGVIADCIGGFPTVLENNVGYQYVEYINAGKKYQEVVYKSYDVFGGGSVTPDHPCTEKCALTWEAWAKVTVPHCSDLIPPFPSCDPQYCCDCKSGLLYKYGGYSTWYGRGPTLYMAHLWEWEC